MIPASMINPSIDIILIGSPERNVPKNPPVNASGIEKIIINGDLSDWNCATMIK